ncbi:MAG: lipid A deacylase LpxR family protein [Rhodospirillales bacterium]|nr:lipid A deacylase LpxR family protein [Rhodospirillales bacterium]
MISRARSSLFGALTALLLPAGLAVAEEPGQIVGIQTENDFFVSNDDGEYTHGMQLSYLSGAKDIPDLVVNGANLLPMFDVGGGKRWGITIAQSMFTPNDIRSPNLLVDDRPYAGWLRGDIGLAADNGDRLDRASLSLGVIGPASYADEMQIWFHEIIKAPRPKGWDHQLSNEPAINLFYERQHRTVKDADLSGLGLEWDLTTRGSFALGNVHTYAGLGAEMRIGQDLRQDYGAPRIGAGIAGSEYFLPGSWDSLGWYVFAGAEARFVARNIFLDGNTFTHSHSVDKNPFVGEFQTGIALTWGHMRLTFTHRMRTKEFDGQEDVDQFGAISLSATL